MGLYVGSERIIVKRKLVRAEDLAGECFQIQFWGVEVCIECEFHGTDRCDGQEILKTGNNAKGKEIPLPDVLDGPPDQE